MVPCLDLQACLSTIIVSRDRLTVWVATGARGRARIEGGEKLDDYVDMAVREDDKGLREGRLTAEGFLYRHCALRPS